VSDDAIPASPDGYQPIVAELDGVPKGVKIDTQHPAYKAATQAAHAGRLSQAQFSRILAHEAQRVHAASKAASAAPKPAAAPRPTAPATDTRPWKSLTFAEKLARGGHV
jgi:hypothetical protein